MTVRRATRFGTAAFFLFGATTTALYGEWSASAFALLLGALFLPKRDATKLPAASPEGPVTGS